MYRHRVIRAEMEAGQTRFRLEGGEALPVRIYDRDYTLTVEGLAIPRP